MCGALINVLLEIYIEKDIECMVDGFLKRNGGTWLVAVLFNWNKTVILNSTCSDMSNVTYKVTVGEGGGH